MKMMIKVFAIALSMITFFANAEIVTVGFKSTVSYSDNPDISVGETIDISLTYDTASAFDGGNIYFDISPGSNITATFENGLVVNTNPAAPNKIDMYSYSYEVAPATFNYDTNFHSYDAVSNTAATVMNMDLLLSNVVSTNPNNALRVTWDDDVSAFSIKDFNVMIDGLFVQSTITEISTAPESPVTVEATTYSAPISSYGGRLYFIRDVINTSTNTVEIKRWAYITWPDGTHYNRDSPKKFILDPMEQNIQTSAYFTVPSYWPAGTYEYHLNSIVVQDGQGNEGTVSQDSFMFTKE
ncbi:hypothetical protein [Colwellia psychrerythraea]|uniref:Uncharacterized protein n=1 Tax=Colwellia psychrerythraea TaxID=28229 RepID=A0A099K7W8_COLPS|nr:hypothetical protein [Colwellia psychrerythraea]KGJ86466.1 hypothetical protein GAB14E_0739 [Colwellia psychrerythraea]